MFHSNSTRSIFATYEHAWLYYSSVFINAARVHERLTKETKEFYSGSAPCDSFSYFSPSRVIVKRADRGKKKYKFKQIAELSRDWQFHRGATRQIENKPRPTMDDPFPQQRHKSTKKLEGHKSGCNFRVYFARVAIDRLRVADIATRGPVLPAYFQLAPRISRIFASLAA